VTGGNPNYNSYGYPSNWETLSVYHTLLFPNYGIIDFSAALLLTVVLKIIKERTGYDFLKNFDSIKPLAKIFPHQTYLPSVR